MLPPGGAGAADSPTHAGCAFRLQLGRGRLLILVEDAIALFFQQLFAAKQLQVGGYHFLYQHGQRVFGRPAQLLAGLAGIAYQQVYLGGAVVAGIDLYYHGADRQLVIGVLAGGYHPFFGFALALKLDLNAQFCKGHAHKLSYGGGDAGGDDKIFGHGLLQHQVHGFYIIFGMAPVALGIQVAHEEFVLQAEGYFGHCPGYFPGYKGFASEGAFVVEEDAIAGKHVVGFAVVDGHPVGVELGYGVGRPGIERRRFRLRNRLYQPVQLGRGGLVHTGSGGEAQQPHGFQNAQGANAISVGGVLGCFEADVHVAHGGQVVDLVGLYLLYDADEVGTIGKVAIMKGQLHITFVRILVEMVNTIGIEQGAPPLDAMYFVAFAEQ